LSNSHSIVLKTFRPLLKLLNVQNIPNSPDMTIIELADHRDFVVKGMSRCVVIIEQDNLPRDIGGMLITSWAMGHMDNTDGTIDHNTFEIYRLHILINSNICNGTSHSDRSYRKITVIHEFTHTIAALSALSRVRTENIINNLKAVLDRKAHTLYLKDVTKLVIELNEPLLLRLLKRLKKISIISQFPDEHYRLGFEDFPYNYSAVYEELLFSEDLLREYCTQEQIDKMCNFLESNNHKALIAMVEPILSTICNEKALFKKFVIRRFYLDIFSSIFLEYIHKTH